jgi:AraC-like DNA-binding protein
MIITLKSHFAQSHLDGVGGQAPVEVPSFILYEKSRQYYWEGQSPLSIKTFFAGRALYTLGHGYCAVDDATYLIVNHDQPYTIAIEADTPVESFCLFFTPGYVEEVHRSLVTQPGDLLDAPDGLDMVPLHFFERTYQHDNLLSPALFHLRAVLRNKRYEHAWLQEQFTDLVSRLLQVHLNVYKEIETIPAHRVATREELYRRLYRAKEYATAFLNTPLTLQEMARVASLSPTHFLRTFKQVFHQTPHQYLTARRLECAQQLLVHTDRSITDICFSLGFESLGSFSWLFSQRVGCSPTAFRSQKGDFREAP